MIGLVGRIISKSTGKVYPVGWNQKESTPSKSKVQWWRRGLIWGFIVTLGIINFGCEKSRNDYYVKYTVGGRTIYQGLELSVTINSEDNKATTFTVPTSGMERTIGPVKEGFEASLEARCTNTNREGNVTLNASISVSKDNGPFVDKKQRTAPKGEPIGISYTIDF